MVDDGTMPRPPPNMREYYIWAYLPRMALCLSPSFSSSSSLTIPCHSGRTTAALRVKSLLACLGSLCPVKCPEQTLIATVTTSSATTTTAMMTMTAVTGSSIFTRLKSLFNVRRAPILLSQFVDYHLTSVFHDSRILLPPSLHRIFDKSSENPD